MMNSCFEQPCPLGFAFLQKCAIQIDFSGSFSYSATANISGISHESTSFMGCVNRKCCGCFGPVGGKKNYCGTECKAKNGGTIVKNVYTWFWVRSSLPKRLWNKCMEYKINVDQGKAAWYKLYNDNAVPLMGRCNQNEPLVNDGIVVVPNDVADQKVPPATGLMKYRKDNEKLYVRSSETWKVISEEEKHDKDIAEVKETLAQHQSLLLIMNKTLSDMTRKVEMSCANVFKYGERQDGIYTIDPDGLGAFKVWCDMTSDRGGWTVFQRRQDKSEDFYRSWYDYRNGFGKLNGNFWLGLDKIHRLTKSGQNVLRVDLADFDNTTAYAKYGTFDIASVSNSYTLAVGGYSGNAGDSLSYHNGMKFSTKDRDNDQSGGLNCAALYKGAWWYNYCAYSNLNGQFFKAGQTSSTGMNWYYWKNDRRSVKETVMKTRPALF